MNDPLGLNAQLDAQLDKMKWELCVKPALWWGSGAVIIAAGLGYYLGRKSK